MAQPEMRWETPTVIWLDAPHAQRLAAYLQAEWAPIRLVDSAAALQEVLAQHRIDRLIVAYSPAWEAAQAVWQHIPFVGVLIAQRDPAECAQWVDKGVTLLTGPLPGNVVQWMRQCDAAQPGAQEADPHHDLQWDDAGLSAAQVGASVSARAGGPDAGRQLASASGRGHQPRIVAFFSTAGGVGKTTTTSIMARLLLERGHRCAIVEADEEKAGILRLFGLTPATRGLDSIEEIIWPDPEALRQEVATIAIPLRGRLQGLVIYPLVGTLEGLQVPDWEVFAGFLQMLSHDYDYVLVDLPPRLRDAMTLATLTAADTVVLCYEPTEANLDAGLRHMANVEEMGRFSRDKYRLVINKVDRTGVPPAVMASTLKLPLLGAVPQDSETYHTLANTGKISIRPESPWRTIFGELAREWGDPVEAVAGDPGVPRAAARNRGAIKPWWRRVLGSR